MSDLDSLQSRIGYQFSDPSHLALALTHRSFGGVNNERLEFLGDSILNHIVAADLFQRFPEATEGQLSRLRARMVKQPTLASVARDLELGELLIMGSGEKKSGGFRRDSILSDAFEAIVGAMLLDAGIKETTERVLALFETRLEALSLDDMHKDAKTRLQEWLQGRGQPVPTYRLIRTQGKSPNQEFEVACEVSDLTEPVNATGTSRRKAEQTAAAKALLLLGEVQ